MKYILTPGQMRLADSTAINDYNIPSIVLMENAARSSAGYIHDIIQNCCLKEPKLLFLCGSGNNGGDGFAIARHLYDKYPLKIYYIGSIDKMSPETLSNFKSVQKIGIQTIQIKNEKELSQLDFSDDIIIDSMIGVGGSENIKGIALSILQKVKSLNSLKISVDAPTGLNTETGFAHPDCFKAYYTITMFAIKTGLLLNDGPDFCGKILLAGLGAPNFIVEKIARTYSHEESDITKELPLRNRRTSKFNYGRVLIVAGSTNYPGAAALCSNAAVASGAGLVQLFTSFLHPGIMPDVIPFLLPQTQTGAISIKGIDKILEASEQANAVTIGPGLSDDKESVRLTRELIKYLPENKNILIDADGLRAVDNNSKLRKNIILTPHTGEFSRITGIPRLDVERDSFNLAREWAQKLNCIILLKHVPSIITNGEQTYLNTNGNPGMATGGSGDVLSGLISALLAQRLEPLKAASLGAYIHASAGDRYVADFSQETLTASGIIESLKEIFPKRQKTGKKI